MADPFAILSKPVPPVGSPPARNADPFAQLSQPAPAQPVKQDPFAQLSQPQQGQSSPLVEAKDPFQALKSPIDKEIETRGAFDKPAIFPEKITDQEIQQIAAKHNVDPSKLRTALPHLGGRPENAGVSDIAAGAASVVTEGALMGVPQKSYKMTQSPAEERALDELQELAAGRKSYLQKGGELAAGLLTGGTEAKLLGGGVKGAMKAGAMYGAGAGFGGSKQGQEVVGTGVGTALGLGIGVAAETVAKPIIGKAMQMWKARSSPAEIKILEQGVADGHIDIQSAADRIAEKTRKSDSIVQDAIASKRAVLSPDEADTLVTEQLHPEELEHYLTRGTPENKLMEKRISEANAQPVVEPSVPEAGSLGERLAAGPVAPKPVTILRPRAVTQDEIKQALAQDILDKHISKFTKETTEVIPKNNQEAFQLLDNWKIGQGGDRALADKYRNYIDLDHGLKAISSEEMQLTGTGKFSERAANIFSSKEPVMRWLDKRAGTQTEVGLEEANTALNKAAAAKNYFKKKVTDLIEKEQKLKLSPESEAQIRNALDTGDFSGLSQIEHEAATAHKALTDEFRDFANGITSEKGINLHEGVTPLSIVNRSEIQDAEGNAQGYLSKFLKSPEGLIRSVQEKEQEALSHLSDSLGRKIRSFTELSPEEFRAYKDLPAIHDLLWPAKALDNVGDLTTGKGLQNALDRIYGREGRTGLETKAKAAMARIGETPDYLLEKNRYKLLGQYIDNTMSHVYLRDPMAKLSNQAQLLRKSGDEYGAQYVENTIKDMRGLRTGSLPAEFRQRMTQANIHFDKLADKYGRDSIAGKIALTAKQIPNILHQLTMQIYPNSMGMNIRSFIQNQLQTLTKTYPELGLKYGVSNLRKATANVALNRKAYIDRIEKMGLMQPQYQEGVDQSIAEGIQQTALWKMPRKVLEANTKFTMALHQFGEENNRAITLAAAEQMSKDIAKGDKWALESLQRFPKPVQRAVSLAKDPSQVEEVLARHLMAQTQYFYSKASMSEFGTIMGPLFTPFTKWPSATFGDILGEVRTKGMSGAAAPIAAKYLAPWALLSGMQYAVFGDKENMSDAEKLLVGRGGLAQAAPITTIQGIARGDILTPPIVKVLKDGIIMPAINGQDHKLEKGITSLFQSFTPGAGTYRFFSQDLETYLDALGK